ncbi:MAG: hypothetical protein WBO32_00795 [Cyclobacteriaceae bacterium]
MTEPELKTEIDRLLPNIPIGTRKLLYKYQQDPGDNQGTASPVGKFLSMTPERVNQIVRMDKKEAFLERLLKNNFLHDKQDDSNFLTLAVAKILECSEENAAIAVSWVKSKQESHMHRFSLSP